MLYLCDSWWRDLLEKTLSQSEEGGRGQQCITASLMLLAADTSQ